MNAADMLVPPPHEGVPEDVRTLHQRAIWDATVTRIEVFLPGFLASVIPAPPPPPPPPVIKVVETERRTVEETVPIA